MPAPTRVYCGDCEKDTNHQVPFTKEIKEKYLDTDEEGKIVNVIEKKHIVWFGALDVTHTLFWRQIHLPMKLMKMAFR